MPQGIELASAYISLIPTTKGIAQQLSRELGQPVDKASREAAQAIERNIGGGANRAADAAKFALSAIGGAAVLAGIKKATDAASGLQQAVGGTGVVFGAVSGRIDSFAESAANAVGLSEQAARELTSTLGASLKGYGFAVDQAADSAIQLTEIGADLAAALGGTTADAVAALSSALRGEFDPLERYGIALRQASIDAKAVELGLADSVDGVDAYARAQAALALITEQAADAQGAFLAETDSAAVAAQVAAANTQNAAADLGEAVLPLYAKVAEGVSTVAQVFAGLPEPVQTGILALGGIAAVAGPLYNATSAVRSLGSAIGGASGLLRFLGPVGAAAGVAAVIYGRYAAEKAEAAAATRDFVAALRSEEPELNVTNRILESLAATDAGTILREAGADFQPFIDAVLEGDAALETFGDVSGRLNFRALEEGLASGEYQATAFTDAITALYESGTLTEEQYQDLGLALQELAPSFADAKVEAANFTAGAESVGLTLPGAAAAIADAEVPTTDFADALRLANDQLADLFNISDSLPVIESGLRDALRAAAEEAARLAENTATDEERFDAFIDAVASSAGDLDDYALALIEQGASADEAIFRTNLLVDEIFALGDEFGVTEQQAADLRAQLNLEYPDVDVAVRAIGLAETTGQLVDLNTQLAALVAGNYGTLTIKDLAASLSVVGRASGGPLAAGQLSLVGEEGPELIRVGAPSMVYSATDTADMLANLGTAGGVGDQNFYFYGPTDAERVGRAARKVQLVWS